MCKKTELICQLTNICSRQTGATLPPSQSEGKGCGLRGQVQVVVPSRQRRRLRGRVTMNSPKDWLLTPISKPSRATGSCAL